MFACKTKYQENLYEKEVTDRSTYNNTDYDLDYKRITDKVADFRNQSIKSLMEILNDEA